VTCSQPFTSFCLDSTLCRAHYSNDTDYPLVHKVAKDLCGKQLIDRVKASLIQWNKNICGTTGFRGYCSK
jgi:hypothetical protein